MACVRRCSWPDPFLSLTLIRSFSFSPRPRPSPPLPSLLFPSPLPLPLHLSLSLSPSLSFPSFLFPSLPVPLSSRLSLSTLPALPACSPTLLPDEGSSATTRQNAEIQVLGIEFDVFTRRWRSWWLLHRQDLLQRGEAITNKLLFALGRQGSEFPSFELPALHLRPWVPALSFHQA